MAKKKIDISKIKVGDRVLVGDVVVVRRVDAKGGGCDGFGKSIQSGHLWYQASRIFAHYPARKAKRTGVKKSKKCQCGTCQTGETNHNPPRLKSHIIEDAKVRMKK